MHGQAPERKPPGARRIDLGRKGAGIRGREAGREDAQSRTRMSVSGELADLAPEIGAMAFADFDPAVARHDLPPHEGRHRPAGASPPL